MRAYSALLALVPGRWVRTNESRLARTGEVGNIIREHLLQNRLVGLNFRGGRRRAGAQSLLGRCSLSLPSSRPVRSPLTPRSASRLGLDHDSQRIAVTAANMLIVTVATRPAPIDPRSAPLTTADTQRLKRWLRCALGSVALSTIKYKTHKNCVLYKLTRQA